MSRVLNWFDKLMIAITFAEADAYESCLESGTPREGNSGALRPGERGQSPNSSGGSRAAKAMR